MKSRLCHQLISYKRRKRKKKTFIRRGRNVNMSSICFLNMIFQFGLDFFFNKISDQVDLDAYKLIYIYIYFFKIASLIVNYLNQHHKNKSLIKFSKFVLLCNKKNIVIVL